MDEVTLAVHHAFLYLKGERAKFVPLEAGPRLRVSKEDVLTLRLNFERPAIGQQDSRLKYSSNVAMTVLEMQ